MKLPAPGFEVPVVEDVVSVDDKQITLFVVLPETLIVPADPIAALD